MTALLIATIRGLGAACGDAEPSDDTTPPTAPANSSPTSPSTSRNDADKTETRIKARIIIGEQRFHATLSESAAARDLIAQLPVRIDMIDHGGVEKTVPLPSPLSRDGQPHGADPDAGDLGYYAPGNDLVLYYGDQSYFPGIVILGRLDNGAAPRISEFDGPVTATVEAHDD